MDAKTVLAQVVAIEKQVKIIKGQYLAARNALKDAQAEISVLRQDRDHWRDRYEDAVKNKQ
jgi:hypothetical protein